MDTARQLTERRWRDYPGPEHLWPPPVREKAVAADLRHERIEWLKRAKRVYHAVGSFFGDFPDKLQSEVNSLGASPAKDLVAAGTRLELLPE